MPRINIPIPGVNFLTVISLVMILIQIWLGSMSDENGAVSAQSTPYYLALGISWDGISHLRIWQFVTHALVHANWFHLVINLLMLWLVGGRVIHILGHKKFAAIVVAGALAGGLLHVITDFFIIRAGYNGMQLVGISGACLALLLTLTTLSPDSKMWPIPVSGKNLGLGLIFAELLLLLMTPALGLPVFSNLGQIMVDQGGGELFIISHACHLGGALAGWLLARKLLVPRPSLADLQRDRERRESEMELGDAG
ncbi:MAG: rhomboid family intramembrane serine protease [Akkermansiaceae bacterium]